MNYEVYTDGACRGNQFDQNLGAWAYLIRKVYDPVLSENKESSYATLNTTNNIMELTAVIRALEHLATLKAYDEKITIYSDSTYVVMGATIWYKGWIKKNWKNVKNVDLWKSLLAELARFKNLTFQHVTGHSGNRYNEYVDHLCNKAMDDFDPEENQLNSPK